MKVQFKQNGNIAWILRCDPGVETVFNNITIVVEDEVNNPQDYVIGINDTWNTFCIFSTDSGDKTFPLNIDDVNGVEGALRIQIPLTLKPARYSKQLQVYNEGSQQLPLLGNILLGANVFWSNLYETIKSSTLPVIMTTVKSGVNVPVVTGDTLTLQEKLDIISMLNDWIDCCKPLVDDVVSDIEGITSTSSSVLLYNTYLKAMRLSGGLCTPYFEGGYLTQEDKAQIINLIVSWRNSVYDDFLVVKAAIEALTDTSTVVEINDVYMLTEDFISSKVTTIPVTNALIALQNQVLKL